MSFKFMHSKIDTRNAVPTLSEVFKQAQTKKALASGQGHVKTASAQQPTKVAKKKEAEEEVEVDTEETEEKGAFPGAAPKFKKKDTAAKKASTSKVAEKEEGETSGQLAPKANPNNEPEKPEGAKGTGGKSKGSDSDEGESSGQLDVEPLHQKGESTGESAGSLDTQKGEGKKEASSGRFVRVAELTDKQKEFLRATWSLYWPKSFIDALLAAK